MLRIAFATSILILALPAWAQQDNTGDLAERLVGAYMRHDTAKAASYFTEDAIRVLPDGIYRRRAEIQHNMDATLKSGLSDLRGHREVTLPLAGGESFRAGTWEAKFGDREIRGYYSLIITTQNGQELIREETVNVSPPRTSQR